jgi:lysozyme
MARKVNAVTLSHIKKSECLRLQAYPDPGSRNGDPWTIGYGSTAGVKKGMVITEAEAEARLIRDLTEAETTVERLVTVPLTDNQFGALVSFVFNVGGGAFAKSTLLRKLNAGDYAAVPDQLSRWNKNDGAVMAGLTKRRAEEAALWSTASGAAAKPRPVPADKPTTPASEPRKGIPGWLILVGLVALAAGALALFTPIF